MEKSMFNKPVLSPKEKYDIKTLLESRLTDLCYFGNFTVERFFVTLNFALSVPDYRVEVYRFMAPGGNEGWDTSPTACRAVSVGTDTEQRSNSTFYVQRMKFYVSLDETVNIPQSPYREVSVGAVERYVPAKQGTWIEYNGVIYTIDGATTHDTIPTLMIIDAKQDSFTKDTSMELDTATGFEDAYLFPGSSIANNTTLPTYPSILLASDNPPVALGFNNKLVRTK
jgi:hypothetical protein